MYSWKHIVIHLSQSFKVRLDRARLNLLTFSYKCFCIHFLQLLRKSTLPQVCKQLKKSHCSQVCLGTAFHLTGSQTNLNYRMLINVQAESNWMSQVTQEFFIYCNYSIYIYKQLKTIQKTLVWGLVHVQSKDRTVKLTAFCWMRRQLQNYRQLFVILYD